MSTTYQTKRCPKCGKVFIDREYREIELEGIRKVDTRRVSPRTIVDTVMLGGVGIATVVNEVWGGIVFLIGAIYIFFDEYCGYNKRQEALKLETEMSRLRLENPKYAQALKENGFYVPEHYINKELDVDKVDCELE